MVPWIGEARATPRVSAHQRTDQETIPASASVAPAASWRCRRNSEASGCRDETAIIGEKPLKRCLKPLSASEMDCVEATGKDLRSRWPC